MGARYAVTAALTAVAASEKTVLELLGGTGLRIRLYDLMWGASGTPADNALVHSLIRITATGTGTAVTPQSLDSADPAAEATAKENETIEPTTSGIPIIELAINQRASYRWVGAPGSEIIVPATAGAGLASRVKSAGYTGAAEHTSLHEE